MLSTAFYLILDLFERYAIEQPASYWIDFQLRFLLPIQKLDPIYQNKHPMNNNVLWMNKKVLITNHSASSTAIYTQTN